MIYCKINGGLGNQMFMYACGYAIAKEKRDILVVDASILDCHPTRKFELDKFKLDDCKIIEFRRFKLKIIMKVLRLIKDIKIKPSCRIVSNDIIGEYKPIYSTNKKNIYLDGLWQTEKYFDKYKNDIKRQFSPKFNLSKGFESWRQFINKTNSIAIHIRLDDYKENGWCIDTQYFKNAIKKIESMIVNPCFFVFSDSMDEAKSIINSFSINAEYIDYDSDNRIIEDLLLISTCQNQIISNSTFSWWGAWLNDNPNKIVICPEYAMWKGDFYPDDWIKIEAKAKQSSN